VKAVAANVEELSEKVVPAVSKTKTPPKAAAKIAKLGKKKDLDLSELRLKEVPEEVRALKHLTKLHLYNNPITELPEWIGELTNLTELLVFGCALRSLPASLSKLPKLRELNVAENKNLSDAKAIEGCKHLEVLDLRHVPSLPTKIAAPLTQLTFGGSTMRELPKWLFGLQKTLKNLSFEDADSVTALPKEISKLSNLEELWLSGGFKALPPELASLKKLRRLDLSDTKIKGWTSALENKSAAKVLAAVLDRG